MTHSIETTVISLGNEPAEALGFKTEEQIEIALIPLMAEILHDKKNPVWWTYQEGKGLNGMKLNQF